jgi:hypothetical protein
MGRDWRVRYYLLMRDLYRSLSTILSVLPLILSGLALVVSFLSFQLTAVRSVKPVLTIAYQSDAGWSLTNVGNGPALNVIVAQRRTEGEWFDPVPVPPLALGGKIRLGWLDHTSIKWLGAAYNDIDGRQYSSTTTEDLTTVQTGSPFPQWRDPDIRKQWQVEGIR